MQGQDGAAAMRNHAMNTIGTGLRGNNGRHVGNTGADGSLAQGAIVDSRIFYR